jgi:tetratricopeptide (TPR) repeat protein
MSRSTRLPVAICIGAAVLALGAVAAPAGQAEFARYQAEQVWDGAVTLPAAAHLEYRHALQARDSGHLEATVTHLQSALALWPQFPDAHFTLAAVYLRQLNPDALYYMVQGLVVTASVFEGQRLLAVNGIVTLLLVFILASSIAWIALAVRYLPFLAHRVAEALRTKFNAGASRTAAFFLLLSPIAVLPGFATCSAVVLLATWPFMQRRERVFSLAIAASFAALAWCAPILDRYSTVADPNSLVSMIAEANYSPADENLTRALSTVPAPGLEAERQTALGMLATRSGDTDNAAAHLLRAISIAPDRAIAYVNLGNVYYLNGQYTKALEGYRKAERADSTDAIGQYNLAQAYIKTLFMSESSRALSRASQYGIERFAESIAQPARMRMPIYPRPFSDRSLWRIAEIEGRAHNPGVFSGAIASATGQTPRVGFWIIVGAVVIVLVMSRAITRKHLAFQCSNCGELTCDGCCKDDRGSVICQACSEAVAGVTSDKVMEALLRQRRQSVVVRRRKSVRWSTVWLPGLRHIFYGRPAAGFQVAVLFTFSALMLWTRGYPLKDWHAIDGNTPLWKWIVPAVGILLSYYVALTSRQRYEVRNTRSGSPRRTGDPDADAASQAGSS